MNSGFYFLLDIFQRLVTPEERLYPGHIGIARREPKCLADLVGSLDWDADYNHKSERSRD
jgi:hypothetical protein